jgi:hypothetical protein
MSIINVILPDGATYQTAEATPSGTNTTTIINTVEERHEVTHTTEELIVPNVLVCDYDKAYDVADTTVPDPLARSEQAFDRMPQLDYGNKFRHTAVYPDHENDTDTTTDSSAIKMYRNIYIEPPPNKVAGFEAPTLFTSGSICVCGEGAYAYIPYSVSGQQIPNTKYILGSVSTSEGDRSHDNDGLLMTKQHETHVRFAGTDSIVTRRHRVHICPDPTDPAILIESQREEGGDYMKFINRGPDETDITDENTVFSIDLTGHIHSTQIQNLHNEIAAQTQLFHQISGLAEENDINITYLTSQIDLLTARVTELEINNPS